MSYRVLGALLAGLLATSSLASAQQATPVPDSKGDFSSMMFLLGTWNCKTTKSSGGRGAGRTETDVTTMVMDGHYMQTDGTSKPFDAARTKTITTRSWVGYDTKTKSWYSFGMGNFGGFGMSTSPGWVGNAMVWTDKYASDGGDLGKTTVTKVSDTKTTSTAVTKTAKGTKTTSDACIKAS
ncbi:MAG: hypothetical protein GIW95_05045 [Candidatus Eremiobacteraeota bacterium]|nr:hypothetical protein [Candidatus Eremiobacteraeota bacterium]